MNRNFCTEAELLASSSPNATLHCLTSPESFSLTFMAGTGLLSLISVLTFFAFIMINALRARRGQRLVQKPMDVYLLSLFVAEIVHGVGAALIFKWIYDGKVQTGIFCNAQGFLLNVGSVTIGLSTLVIAAHTFICLWWSKSIKFLATPYIIIASCWIFTLAYAVIAFLILKDPTDPYYRPTPYWCWISPQFLIHRIAGQWLWLWIALFFSLLFYSLLFFRSRGVISLINTRHSAQKLYASKIRRASYAMILYAISYCVLVLPTSVTRWSQFVQLRQGHVRIPMQATIGVLTVYNLSGIVNVIIFLFTRSGLLLFGMDADGPDNIRVESRVSWESGGTTASGKGKGRASEPSIGEINGPRQKDDVDVEYLDP